MSSPHSLRQRSMLLQAIRSFFFNRDYIEVDTPIRLPVLLPEAHIQPFTSDGWFLQTSPELCMKMLLAGGCEQIFQLCHCFRKEESGCYHQTEFTMLEWYHRGWDYTDLMSECEDLFNILASRVSGLNGLNVKGDIVYKGRTISLGKPWSRLSLRDAFVHFADITADEAIAKDRFEEILVEEIEPHLGWERPVFLYDYPVQLASLAKVKDDSPDLAERFELYIGGLELANGFSELVDAAVQRERFVQEMGAIRQLDRDVRMPEQFLQALERLGDTAGIALGVDRVMMLLLGKEKLTEILPIDVRIMQ
ncbi:EF-P lysine aminoacylase EpmA [Desulfogranum marinum]|uniref:EF-P lysine aminoacylase EpmA n=1 Tax=Desulfogranum marinum TaxID=453220 RepID=UPI0029C94692|nr:EF-P lysine aminoacylase EpmA [Desulfogranum marinum]